MGISCANLTGLSIADDSSVCFHSDTTFAGHTARTVCVILSRQSGDLGFWRPFVPCAGVVSHIIGSLLEFTRMQV
jgi:hypothetical protein